MTIDHFFCNLAGVPFFGCCFVCFPFFCFFSFDSWTGAISVLFLVFLVLLFFLGLFCFGFFFSIYCFFYSFCLGSTLIMAVEFETGAGDPIFSIHEDISLSSLYLLCNHPNPTITKVQTKTLTQTDTPPFTLFACGSLLSTISSSTT